jgi:glycerol uptake facilitator-like aquaporin
LKYRALFGEFFGTAVLVATVIGSGIMGTNLSGDKLLVLLVNSIATSGILGILILTLTPVSGAHFNPLVTIALALTKQFSPDRIFPYVIAQLSGAIFGTGIAHVMFGRQVFQISSNQRFQAGTAIAEMVATVLLIFVILALLRNRRENLIPLAVPAVIGAGYFFTSSTSFANPAVTVGRMFSDSFAGIAPESVTGFIGFQILGASLALILVKVLFSKRN